MSKLYRTVNDFEGPTDALEAIAMAVDHDLSALDVDDAFDRLLFPQRRIGLRSSPAFGLVVEVGSVGDFVVTVAAMREEMQPHERVLGRFEHVEDVVRIVRSERERHYGV